MVGRTDRAPRSMGIIAVVFLVVAACAGGASTGASGALPIASSAPKPAAGTQAPAPGQGTTGDTPAGALVVRTGSLQLQVKDLTGTLPRARELVGGLGGYVAGSEERTTDEQQVATITYRIPVERWQDAINGLRGLADKVLSETTASEEVTAQVVDLDARLVNLRATEASLRDIMTRAANRRGHRRPGQAHRGARADRAPHGAQERPHGSGRLRHPLRDLGHPRCAGGRRGAERLGPGP